MGPTGAGKSTFVDRAVGIPHVGASVDSVSRTEEVRPVRYPYSDGVRNVVLVDTPEFDDMFITDVQILRQIANWLNATYEKNIKLSSVLYLHRISDNGVSGTSLRNYNMFKELCGKDNFKNVILVTTMWDEVTEEVGSAREKELQSDFWRSMLSLGSTTHRFEGTMESAWRIINSLSVAPPIQRRPLQIQREMVDAHVPLHKTAAGRTVLATLFSLMSGVKEIFKRHRNRTQSSLNAIQRDSTRLRRSRSLFSTTAVYNLSSETGIIALGSSGTCSAEGYQSSLGQVISALRDTLSAAEFVRVRYLKNMIVPSLSIALFIEVNLYY
ncbi:hypothetical protein EDC04DRAFT_2586758 [Pisolithus marmoratus]|nr:hypothetical protein EDC04DRAFT_2586758 [Pisolithus marmoratus]